LLDLNNFCTLFDSNFLTRGLALYESLANNSTTFKLYIYCFDDLTYQILEQMALPNVTPVSLKDFESPELLSVKGGRSVGEYCWTCTPHIIRHAIQQFELQAVTYLDADLYFFESPSLLIDEWNAAGASVLITEHRYTKRYKHLLPFGIYCVQFVAFRMDERGMAALNWWAERCIEWCYAHSEDGKFGDQKYLDDWTTRFNGVHVLKHLGGGVAPWNVQQYRIQEAKGQQLYLEEAGSSDKFQLVFYHFHGLQIFHDGEIDLSAYALSSDIKKYIYQPYIEALSKAAIVLSNINEEKNFHGLKARSGNAVERMRMFKRRIQRRMLGTLNLIIVRDVLRLK
jgi:hypothetical protein